MNKLIIEAAHISQTKEMIAHSRDMIKAAGDRADAYFSLMNSMAEDPLTTYPHGDQLSTEDLKSQAQRLLRAFIDWCKKIFAKMKNFIIISIKGIVGMKKILEDLQNTNKSIRQYSSTLLAERYTTAMHYNNLKFALNAMAEIIRSMTNKSLTSGANVNEKNAILDDNARGLVLMLFNQQSDGNYVPSKNYTRTSGDYSLKAQGYTSPSLVTTLINEALSLISALSSSTALQDTMDALYDRTESSLRGLENLPEDDQTVVLQKQKDTIMDLQRLLDAIDTTARTLLKMTIEVVEDVKVCADPPLDEVRR